jgi:KIF-1 binding protein C terminal
LSHWETDPKRKIAMHQRRIDTLAPVLDVLNPNVFQVILKETSLDVAQVMMSLKDAVVVLTLATFTGSK